jgi:hypothetical protein
MNMGRIVQQASWGLTVTALLGLSGCLAANRAWVQEQLAPVQVQVAEMRDRVAVVEEQVRRLDPKVDRIITQMEQRSQQGIASDQPPAGTGFTSPPSFAAEIPGNLQAAPDLDFMIAGGSTPWGGETKPPNRPTVETPVDAGQRPQPRELTEDQRTQLLQTLREDPKVPLAVVSISGDNESQAFAQKLDMLFDIAGWPTQGVSRQTVSGVPPGLTFVTKSGDAPVVAQAARLQDALHAMGIVAQSSALDSMPPGLLMLVVGPNPPYSLTVP